MNDSECPPAKRMRFSCEELQRNNKDEIITLYLKQQQTIEKLQERVNLGDHKDYKTQLAETSRRENVLVMRLATKEQELQDYAAQIAQIKKSQEDTASKSLREAMLDPAVNLMFNKMKDELKETKDKLEQAQSELSAWKFTPDSQSGKKLMSRCRTLIAENQELGRQLSQGKVAQLEAELALQKKYSEELKESQEELNEIVIQLDEEVEGMQSTIQLLQQQLIDSKKEIEKYKKIVSDMTNSKSRFSQGEFRTKDLDLDVKIEHECSDTEMDVADEYLDVKNEGFVSPDGENFNEKRSLGSGDSDYDDYVRTREGGRKRGTSGDDRNGGRSSVSSEREIIDETCDSTPERTMARNSSVKDGEDVSSPRDSDAHNKSTRTSQTREDYSIDSGEEKEPVVRIFSTKKMSDDNVAERGDLEVNPSNGSGENLKEINGHLVVDKDICSSETETDILDKDTSLKCKDRGEEYKATEEYKENGNREAAIETAQDGIPEGVNDKALRQTKDLAHQNSVEDAENAKTSIEKKEPQVPGIAKESPQQALDAKVPVTSNVMNLTPASALINSNSNPTSFLLNPQIQQQQALMAEQAAILYKTILAQQQQQLAMVGDKNARLPDGAAEEDMRTVNPLLQGLQYATDPSHAAYLAPYKALLAAQQMLMPTADGKTPQSAGGLGLYPGFPLVQQNLVSQHNSESATNGVPSSWAAGTNVAFPHPLLPIHPSFIVPTQAGPKFPPGPNLTPHGLATNVEGEKHHGSGDHGPLQNGLPVQKQSETPETKAKEDTHTMA